VHEQKTVRLSLFICLGAILLTIPTAYALEPIWTYSSPGASLGGVTMSANGSAIAVGAEKIWLFSRNGELLAKEPYGNQVLSTPDGVHLLTAYGSTLYFFERNATKSSFQKKWEYELPGRIRSIDMSDDSNIIAAALGAEGTYIFSSSGKMTGTNSNHSAIIRVYPYGQTIVGASTLGFYRYSPTGIRYLYQNISIGSQPDVMEIVGTGGTVVYNDAQRLVSVTIATADGAEQWKTRATADITSLAVASTGTRILVGTQNGNLDVFNDTGFLVWSYPTNPTGNPSAWVTGVALSSDGKIAVAGTYDGKIVALDSSGRELWSNVTKDHINHIAMSSDGSLVVATGDETVYAFSLSARPLSTARSLQVTASPVQQKNVTTILVTTATQKPVITDSGTRTITSEPTPYSVIRTATQSPVSEIIPFLGVVVAVLLIIRRL
jgi:WD40 repeat protein